MNEWMESSMCGYKPSNVLQTSLIKKTRNQTTAANSTANIAVKPKLICTTIRISVVMCITGKETRAGWQDSRDTPPFHDCQAPAPAAFCYGWKCRLTHYQVPLKILTVLFNLRVTELGSNIPSHIIQTSSIIAQASSLHRISVSQIVIPLTP